MISSVNVNKAAVFYGFGHSTEEILNEKLNFFCVVQIKGKCDEI